MAGVKAGITNAVQNAGRAGTLVANAGQNEPSIDDILASIRQIISEQNRQADNAAEKAAAEVANKASAPANIESIIGTVAADHWSGDAVAMGREREFEAVQPGGPKVQQTFAATHQDGDLNELDELIQLIGSTPPAPRIPTPTNWIDPKSNGVSFARSIPPESMDRQRPLIVAGSSINAPVNSGGAKPVVQLPVTDTEVISKAVMKPAAQLHPSVSPMNDVPQVIKNATVEPSLNKMMSTPKPSGIDKPMVSPKSALDRLIAKKEGGVVRNQGGGIPSAPQPKPIAAPANKPAVAARAPVKAQAVIKPTAQASKPSPPPAAVSAKAVNAAVVKSIERLATSMFADRKDEIDGMMAGIVRPMLQDWLEDNLPSLVERIVREEIERVSRGTHR